MTVRPPVRHEVDLDHPRRALARRLELDVLNHTLQRVAGATLRFGGPRQTGQPEAGPTQDIVAWP